MQFVKAMCVITRHCLVWLMVKKFFFSGVCPSFSPHSWKRVCGKVGLKRKIYPSGSIPAPLRHIIVTARRHVHILSVFKNLKSLQRRCEMKKPSASGRVHPYITNKWMGAPGLWFNAFPKHVFGSNKLRGLINTSYLLASVAMIITNFTNTHFIFGCFGLKQAAVGLLVVAIKAEGCSKQITDSVIHLTLA